MKRIWSILKSTFTEFGEDKALRLSAALAYYAMFSIGPLLVIVLGLAGLAFGHAKVRGEIDRQMQSVVGASAAKTLDSMMSSHSYGKSLLTTIVGLVALALGATGVFAQLQDSLNTIWEVQPKPGAGVWAYIRSRFLSLSMVLGIGFLLLVSMALSTFLAASSNALGQHWTLSKTLGQALTFVVSFGVITVLFAMIFKYLPDVKVPFRKVWVGALATALLFTVGKSVLSIYLGRAGTTSSYGAAGSVIAILMWVYYASVILFLGAEFTQVYTHQTGGRAVPTKYSEPVTEEGRAQEGIPHQQQSKRR